MYRGYVYGRRAKLIHFPIFQQRRAELTAVLAKVLDVIDIYVATLVSDQRTPRRIETARLDLILARKAGLAGFEKEKWSRWPRLVCESALDGS